jgi:glycosyltransferase involved in cell wall biosynthesis
VSQFCEANPLVSIIIPCFNAERWIGQAVDSCLQQTYQNREVIVIDDGSRDQSLKRLKQFGNAIRWETGPNYGGCHARNRGLVLARGSLIQFLDSDDFLHPTKLERQVPEVARYDDAIVYCDHYSVSPDGESLLRSEKVLWSDPVEFVLKHQGLTTIGPLHRRRWLEEVGGFRKGLRASQELDLHLRLAAAGYRFVHIAEALFTVRRRNESVSSNPAISLQQWAVFMPDLIETLKSNSGWTDSRRKLFARHLASAARQVLRNGDRSTGQELYALATRLDVVAADSAYGKVSRMIKRLVGPYRLEQMARLRETLGL